MNPQGLAVTHSQVLLKPSEAHHSRYSSCPNLSSYSSPCLKSQSGPLDPLCFLGYPLPLLSCWVTDPLVQQGRSRQTFLEFLTQLPAGLLAYGCPWWRL